jgi:heme/copper-type cytochrome/quinol oxidase subunit 1
LPLDLHLSAWLCFYKTFAVKQGGFTVLFLLIAVFAAMALYQVPLLIREKLWRELAAFSFIWILAFSLSLLLTLGVELPSPTDGIERIIHKTGELFR